VPGAHLVWTLKNGSKLVIETLWSLLQTIETRYPGHTWLTSATNPDFDLSLN
jgi:hypothetical protein